MHKFIVPLALDLAIGALAFFQANHAKRALGASESVIGALGAVGPIVYLVSCAVLTRLASQAHARLILVIASVGLTAVMGVQCAWISLASFFVVSAGLSVFGALYFIHFQVLIRQEAAGGDLRRSVGIYNLAWGIGYALGPGAAGWLYDQWPLAPLGPAVALPAGVIALTIRRRPVRTAGPSAASAATPEPADHRYVWLGWPAVFAATLAVAAARQMFPAAGKDLGWDSWRAGAVLFVMIFVMALTSGALIFVRSYVYHLRWKVLAHVLGAAGWALFASTTDFAGFLLAAVPIGLWSGACVYAGFFYSMNHPDTARTVSVNELLVGLGLAAGAGLGGLLAESSMHLPYWVNTALVIALLAFQVGVRLLFRPAPAPAGR